MARRLVPVEVLEDWLVAEGHLPEKVDLKDYEVWVESEYMRTFLYVLRERHHLINPVGFSFRLEIPFGEDTLFSIIKFALDSKK